jgi:DnaJ-class molecular chaperone
MIHDIRFDECQFCDGSGRHESEYGTRYRCDQCDGTGAIEITTTLVDADDLEFLSPTD